MSVETDTTTTRTYLHDLDAIAAFAIDTVTGGWIPEGKAIEVTYAPVLPEVADGPPIGPPFAGDGIPFEARPTKADRLSNPDEWTAVATVVGGSTPVQRSATANDQDEARERAVEALRAEIG